jgi:hypothetical protein
MTKNKLYCLVLKSKLNLNVSHLTTYFITLWKFIGDVSLWKALYMKNIPKSFKFLLQPSHMISWDIDKSHNFQTSFAFSITCKSFRQMNMVMFPGQDVQNYPWFHGKYLKLG